MSNTMILPSKMGKWVKFGGSVAPSLSLCWPVNKIILNLSETKKLDSDVIREVAIIDVFARELSGRIVLSSTDPELKNNILTFAKPPVVPFLASVDLALDYFKKMTPDADSEESSEEVRKALAAKEKELEALKAQVKSLDPAQITKLKSEKTELQTRCKQLEKQVETMLKNKRDPVDASGFLEKITTLEDTVKKLSASAIKKE